MTEQFTKSKYKFTMVILIVDVYSGVTVDVPRSPVQSLGNGTRLFLTPGNLQQQDLSGASSPCGSLVAPDSSDSEDDIEYSEDVNGHVIENGMRMRKLPYSESQKVWMSSKLHEPEEGERKYGSLRATALIGRDFEELERQSAENYTKQLLKFLPSLLNCPGAYEIDQSILEFSSRICDSWYPLFFSKYNSMSMQHDITLLIVKLLNLMMVAGVSNVLKNHFARTCIFYL